MGSSSGDSSDEQPYVTDNAKWLARLDRSLPADLSGPRRPLIAADKPNLLRDAVLSLVLSLIMVAGIGTVGPNEGPGFFIAVWLVTSVLVCAGVRRQGALDTIYAGPGWIAGRKVTGHWRVVHLSRLTEVHLTPPADTPPPVVLWATATDGAVVRMPVRAEAWDKVLRSHLLQAAETPASLRPQIIHPLPLRMPWRKPQPAT